MSESPETVATWWAHYSAQFIPEGVPENTKAAIQRAFYFGFGTGMSQLQKTFNESSKDMQAGIKKIESLHAECATPFHKQH